MKAKTEGTKKARKRAPRKRGPTSEDGARTAALVAALVCLAVIVATTVVVLSSPKGSVSPSPVIAQPSPEISLPKETAVPEVAAPTVEASPNENRTASPAETPQSVTSSPTPPASPVSPPRQAPKLVKPQVIARPSAKPKAPVERPAPEIKGTVAFVIDDAGNNLRELEPFLKLPFKLTIAVLPGLPHSAEAARRARAAGKEVILHQPMEAIGGQNPGPGAIDTGMDAATIRAVLAKNVAEIGPIVGMNNHQGSKVTMDTAAMETVLAFCRDNGLYYLDSRTTADTVVPAVAAGLGIRIRERDVFVDNIQEKAAMIRFVQEGLQKAEKKGAAVMIGHAWSSELADTLRELYPELVEQGFSLSTISRIMMGTWDEDEGLGD